MEWESNLILKKSDRDVKEQRANGSWCLEIVNILLMHLRCALIGLERGYQVKTPSKQLNNKSYSL